MRFLLLGLMMVFGFSASVHAETELTMTQEQTAAELYAQLKCPVCKNQSLAASSSYMAKEMREQIREFVAQGQSYDAVIEYYVQRYGTWILTEPPKRGLSLWVWFIPGASILMALTLVIGYLVRRRAGVPTQKVDQTDITNEERLRLQQLIQEVSQ